MKKLVLLFGGVGFLGALVLLLLCASPAEAQTPTLVSGTITDANGVPYSFAKVSAQLIPTTASPTIIVNGIPTQIGGQQNANADTNGSFTMNLFCNSAGGGCSVISPSGTQWQITVNENGSPPPIGTGPQTCSATVTVTGATQSVTASFSACPALGRSSGGGGTPGGTTLQGQINNGGVFGGTSCFNLSTLTGPLNFDCDTHPKGPNPYVDVTRYGVRSTSSGVAPAIPGITATISASSTSATLSSASTFQYGDGVSVLGAGAACTLTAPASVTVTPSVLTGGYGLQETVAGPAGSTTYNYQVISTDKLGCYTAASTTATTTTGAATLGAASATISGATRSGNVITYNVPSGLGFVSPSSNELVHITFADVNDAGNFGGWFRVASVPTATTFTVTSGLIQANGAPTASNGAGVVHWQNVNHICWTSDTAPWMRYIYGRTSGSMALVGASLPEDNGAGYDVTCWDDPGSTETQSQKFPYFVPTTPPVSSGADTLVTTISSGAGTTTLTLANAATTSVTGGTILFDNAPNIATAATAAGGGMLYFPAGIYVTNSYLTIPFPVTVNLAGAILAPNVTIQASNQRWLGMINTQAQGAASFGWPVGGFINGGTANPVIFSPNGNNDFLEGIQITSGANGQIGWLSDGGGSGAESHFKNVNFIGASTNGYIDIPYYQRGGFWYDFDHVMFATGPGQEGGGFTDTTYTPGAVIISGSFDAGFMSVQDRGIWFEGATAGDTVTFWGETRDQGGIMPFFSNGTTAGVTQNFTFGNVQIDTSGSAARFANFGSTNGLAIFTGATGSNPALGYHSATGNPMNLVLNYSGGDGQNTNIVAGTDFSDRTVQVNGAGELGFKMSLPLAPASAVVSAGGSVSVGTHTYSLAAIDINGNQTTLGPTVSAVTTTGNQTVTITTPATPPAGAVNYALYRDGIFLTNSGFNCANFSSFSGAGSGLTYVDSAASGCNNSAPTANLANSSSVSSNGLNSTAFNLIGGGFKNVESGTFTASRTRTVQDASGTEPLTIASGTATLGTAAIAAGACATVVTTTATGTLTTDNVIVGFNGDPTAVTGYGASATGAVLTIYPYPTADTANFKVCNSTASSITPSALALNWRVVR